MITVSKGELRQNLLEYLRQVEETGEEIIVTGNDSPVLKIISLKNTKDAFADGTKKCPASWRYIRRKNRAKVNGVGGIITAPR